MRAYQHTFTALNAKVGVPYRNFLGDVALLPHGGSSRKGAVNRQRTDRQRITIAGDDGSQNVADEKRRFGRNGWKHVEYRRHATGNLHFAEIRKCLIYGGIVFLNDGVAPLSVCLLDRFFYGSNRLVAWQYPADGKEAGLHDGVDAGAHSGFAGDFIGVNHKEPKFLLEDSFLHLARNVIPDFARTKRRVQ